MNLNFTGFHKILKKHDKCLPNPCKAFYISRLHDQNWVRGDYSDVIVILSRVYSAIRGDEAVKEKESEKQVKERRDHKYIHTYIHTMTVIYMKDLMICILIFFIHSFIIYELYFTSLCIRR